jgi:Tfp pilus assembly pilus retraction ATPase PilT
VFEDNQCVVEQREVGLDTLSFAHALKHVLRQDPDVIMINFNQALYNLVKQGQVSEREALSKASDPQALEMNFKGIFLDEGRRILN